MSIKIKLLSSIISALIIIGSLTGIVIYRQNTVKLVEHVNEDMQNSLNYISQLINFYLNRAEDNLTNLSKDPIAVEALETKNAELLHHISQDFTTVNDAIKIIENIALQEIKGSRCTPITANKEAMNGIGKDFSERDYCKGIIKTNQTYLSDAFIGTILQNPTLGLVVPVKNVKKDMIGFVYGSISLTELRNYLLDLQTDSSVVLLDRYGTVFLDTKNKISTLDNNPDKIIKEIQKRLNNNQNEGHFELENKLVAYRFNGSMTIVYEKSKAKLVAFTNSLNMTVLYAGMLAILLLIIIVVLFVGKITERITHLGNATKKITQGQFDIKLSAKDLKANDEIGGLAKAFNVMAIKLKNLYKELDEKVKSRTSKLQESEEKIKKTLELSEQTNKLMVGRELKMKEMKKTIEDLEAKNKQS